VALPPASFFLASLLTLPPRLGVMLHGGARCTPIPRSWVHSLRALLPANCRTARPVPVGYPAVPTQSAHNGGGDDTICLKTDKNGESSAPAP